MNWFKNLFARQGDSARLKALRDECHAVRLEINEGDVVGVFYDGYLTRNEHAAIKEVIVAALPGIKVLVLDGSAKLTVLGREQIRFMEATAQ